MKCPKCKIEIDPKMQTCPNCNTKLVVKCPKCGAETKIGTSSCKTCGFVFVKFCKKCGSANYLSAKQCRKCYTEFPEETPKNQVKTEPKTPAENKKETENTTNSTKISIIIDFINLPTLFDKFEDEEFRQKVILNIKTAIKLSFNVKSEYLVPKFSIFNITYTPNYNLTAKIQSFKEEFRKFNEILSETLGEDIYYKILISSNEKGKEIVDKLNYGAQDDIIVTSTLYDVLKEEMNLIKISQDTYKVISPVTEELSKNTEQIKEYSALDKISKALVDSKNKINAISINAPQGVGKTHLINNLQAKYAGENVLFLRGQCSALTQISPMGLIQDIFITLFNLSFTSSKHEKKLKEIRTVLSKAIQKNPDIRSDQIETLINLLYPIKEDIYENILYNKNKTFEDLKLILDIIKAGNKIVVVIDDFDLIDETSYEFLKYLIDNDFFINGTKLIITHRRDSSVLNNLISEKLNKRNILDISLAPKTLSELSSFILDKFKIEKPIKGKVLNQIIENAKGNFAYIEQVLSHMEDMEIITTDGTGYEFDNKYEEYFVAQTFEEIIKLRFNHLKKYSNTAFNLLGLASFLGGKFNQNSLIKTLNISEEEFIQATDELTRKNFICRLYKDTYIFKNNLVWTYIWELAKNDKILMELGRSFLNNILHLAVTTPGIKALLAQQAGNQKMTFELWTQSLKLASFIGDIGLYITSQKQSIKNLDNNYKNSDIIKKNISERLGKLIYARKPKESIEYLAQAINYAEEDEDIPKIVELTGYLITSTSMVQNYHGVIEAVDNILKFYQGPKFALERAMVKSRKLGSLIKIGDWEEAGSIVNSEINPILQNYLKKPKKIDFATYKDIYTTWMNSNIQLAECYSMQGIGSGIELLNELEREIFRNTKIQDKTENIDLKVSFLLTKALNYTLAGYIKLSEEILQTIVKDYSWAIEDGLVVSKWNLINMINKIISNECKNIGEELFNAVTFANNCGDDFNKNIFKILLGYVFIKDNNAMKALDIAKEQMTYFSTEKLAFGALMSWYISAKATYMLNQLDDAIDICEKSLKISQSAKINCEYFTCLFQMLLANCYLKKGDEESAKMYNEMSIEIANRNDITLLKMLSNEIRTKIMQENIMRIDSAKRLDFAKKIAKILDRTYGYAKSTDIQFYIQHFKKEKISFKAFCKLNNLEETKSK